ncbi:FecR family protein [Echinicola shivajiensis]|uniref:FecR family protein n=1 Tax=Echinicola shivajiensis TaxID=1035916 RepID=UPI001BFC1CB5|nr:FecR domain-containing protein [Echinicola shivajiensis]
MENWDLLIRKIQGSLNDEEEELFKTWLEESHQNRQFFHELKLLKGVESDQNNSKELDANAAWENVLEKYKERKKEDSKKIYPSIFFKYAAVLIAVLSLSYLLWNLNQSRPNIDPANTNEITLINEAGEVQVINLDQEIALKDQNGKITGRQKNDQIVYTGVVGDELIYNELVIPYGKKIQLALSDGTEVYLNAGSSLKYPVNFVRGKNREVYLKGEAYFDVSKDDEHPFLVNTEEVNVRVYGTQFNVSSYPEDHTVSTVLVEGSVGLYDSQKSYEDARIALLEPGFKGEWSKEGKFVEYEKVDVDIYLGWKEGKLILKNQPFSTIIAKLERHYNIEIKNLYSHLNDQVFTATFDIESIEEVLNSFKEDTPFSYQVKNNIITIRKP